MTELQELMSHEAGRKQSEVVHPSGTHIVVLDRGFIYVGDIAREGEYWRITNARNIRYWGTTKGLGEIAAGPTDATKADPAGTVIVPAKSVIHLLVCPQPNRW
jgi:hypothetical protein